MVLVVANHQKDLTVANVLTPEKAVAVEAIAIKAVAIKVLAVEAVAVEVIAIEDIIVNAVAEISSDK